MASKNLVEIRSVLVTGGLGFVGGRIVQHIHDKYPQCRITVLDTRLPADQSTKNSYTEYVQGDITSESFVREVLLKVRPQTVVHSAAISPSLSERYGRRIEKLVSAVNVGGTRNMLLGARDAGVVAFVYTSSCTAVTDNFAEPHANIDERWPTVEPGTASMYGESKAQAEDLVFAANTVDASATQTAFRTCSLRPAVVFGEGDYALLPSFVNLIEKGETAYRLGDGLNLWDTVYVGNVADAHVLALENLLSANPTAAGESFFIQNNEPVSTRDLMLFVWREFNGHVPPFEVGIPASLGWVVGILAEAYTWVTGKPTTLSRGSVTDAIAMRYASGEKAMRILGYEPRVGLEDGLRLSCQEYAARLRSDDKKVV